jgi:hypothetical protein
MILGVGGKPNKGNKHMNPMESHLSGDESGATDHLVEDEESSSKSGKISFNKPAGFKVPEGVKDGEAFDAMATVKLVNGKLVLSELDGTPVDDEHEGDGTEDSENTEDSETPSDKSDDSEPSTQEPDENDSAESEPQGFLDAIEKKASKNK